MAAARAARCHEFILRLPDGYDSLVGERGQSLSGGERQRILDRPRVFLDRDPRILILDQKRPPSVVTPRPSKRRFNERSTT